MKYCNFEEPFIDGNICTLTVFGKPDRRRDYRSYCRKDMCPIWQIYLSLRPTITEEKK